MPNVAVLPYEIQNDSISFDILSRLKGKGPADARASPGLAYRNSADCDAFESVFLRHLNELNQNPPPPQHKQAVWYFAYSEWRFERLREIILMQVMRHSTISAR